LALALLGAPLAANAADLVSAPALEDPGPGLVDRFDPWEGMNRGIYRFNANFDRYLFLPALRGYRFVVPSIVRRGFSNFFSNLGEITTFGNSVLQLSPRKSAGTLGRFVVNTTVGIGGVFDPAWRFGLFRYDEDFGQTLGHYGLGPGPYLVLPILGPSSLRDTFGIMVDTAAIAMLQSVVLGNSMKNNPALYSIYGVQAMQLRDDTPFHYGELGPFEYDLVRLFFLEHRQLLVDH
jgi:phospholipid-binding lipoprotein MlaA